MGHPDTQPTGRPRRSAQLQGQGRRSSPWILAAGGIGLILLLLVVATLTPRRPGSSGGPLEDPAAVNAPVTKLPARAETAAVRQAVVDSVEMRRADLAGDWTPVASMKLSADDLAAAQGCSHRSYPARQAGRELHYSFDLRPNGMESGHVFSVVELARSPEVAALQVALHDTPEYPACHLAFLQKDMVTRQMADPGSPHGASIHRLPRFPSLTSAGWRAVVHFRYRGQPYTQYIDTYVMYSGRLFAYVEFRRCCDPFEVAFEHQSLGPISSRLQNANRPTD
jgi:hypothetical protein